jgi:hypothetical protein
MRIALIVSMLILGSSASSRAGEVHGVPLPRRAKTIDGEVRSPLGFRKTVEYYKKFTRRLNHSVERIPTRQSRGVTLTRFLTKSGGSAWSAIQIYLYRGTTWLHIVPKKGPGSESREPQSQKTKKSSPL